MCVQQCLFHQWKHWFIEPSNRFDFQVEQVNHSNSTGKVYSCTWAIIYIGLTDSIMSWNALQCIGELRSSCWICLNAIIQICLSHGKALTRLGQCFGKNFFILVLPFSASVLAQASILDCMFCIFTFTIHNTGYGFVTLASLAITMLLDSK